MNIRILRSPNRSARTVGDLIDLIIVHSSVGSFDGSLSWLRDPESGVSSHYLVGPGGDIVRLVDEADVAYHAGVSFWRGRSNLNRYSVGIEIANRTGMKGFAGQDPYPAAQLQATAWLIGDICRRRRIEPDRTTIVSHADIAPRRKHDPIGLDMDMLRSLVAPQLRPAARQDLYFVVPSVCNVRQGPGTGFAIAGQLKRGERLIVDGFTTGERLSGSDQWAHLSVENACRDLGFIHSRLLRQ